jgi:hypothetical protein
MMNNCEQKHADFQMSYFLAGLIDADGHISKKCISISFHTRDLKVAHQIQKYIGHGTVRTIAGKNALSYDLYDLEGTHILANAIMHKLRNPNRIIQFNTRLVNRNQSNKTAFLLTKTVLDESLLASNSWLAGFIQGDGSFQIKLTPKNGKTPYRTHVVIQIDQKTNTLLKRIQSEFGGSVGYRKFQDTYYYSSGSFINAKRLIDYLDTHVVLGLNWDIYVLWRNAYEMVKLKKHLTHQGLNQLAYLKGQLSMLKATK